MDLRFEAFAANELYENTKNDLRFVVLKFIGITCSKILTLDKVDGISIREIRKLRSRRRFKTCGKLNTVI